MIKIKYPHYYKQFRCIADACEKTCCAAWQVVIDESAENRYKSEKSPIGDKLRECMFFDGEDNVFRLNDGRCPFLDRNNLCEIYSCLGEQALCRTCEKYPRFEIDFGGRKELGLSVSCPTAARLILLSNVFPTYFADDVDSLPTPNSTDPELYFAVMTARNHISEIVRESRNLAAAFDEILKFAEEFQKLIGQSDLLEKTKELTRKTLNLKEYVYSSDYLETLLPLERLDPNFNKLIASCGNSQLDFSVRTDELKLLFEYYLYRYFSSAVFDRNVIFPVKFAVFSVCCVSALLPDNADDNDIINSVVAYSREVEHSQKNLDKLKNIL